jgi:trehalose-6-phosphatase
VEKIRTFFAGFAGKVTPLLLLDYDGTLAPFRVDRFLARPWAGVRELLTRIQ